MEPDRTKPASLDATASAGSAAPTGPAPGGTPAPESLDPQRVTLKIDRQTTIVEASPESGLGHEMLGLVRVPDGTLFLRTQTQGMLTSADAGETWQPLPVHLSDAPAPQTLHGLGVSRDGDLWLMHQSPEGGEDLFVSVSPDRGKTWRTRTIDYGNLAPGAPEHPYAYCLNDYNSFFQRPDGSMALGIGLRHEDHGEYQQVDQSRPGFHETLIRSTDGGKTWGDPTEVHAHVAETDYAVDPQDPDHILAFTRKQRMLLRGEDPEEVGRAAGVPPDTGWPWKGALLLESTDGGRSFTEVPDSYLGYYSHRGTILWTTSNAVVLASAAGQTDGRRLARVSLDGGRSWVDGSPSGTARLNQATPFVLLAPPPEVSFTAPMVELAPNSFLMVHAHWHEQALEQYEAGEIEAPWLGIRGLFFHLENEPAGN